MVFICFTKNRYKHRAKLAMGHHNTVLFQLLKLIPGHEEAACGVSLKICAQNTFWKIQFYFFEFKRIHGIPEILHRNNPTIKHSAELCENREPAPYTDWRIALRAGCLLIRCYCWCIACNRHTHHYQFRRHDCRHTTCRFDLSATPKSKGDCLTLLQIWRSAGMARWFVKFIDQSGKLRNIQSGFL